jgi:outer membrane protein assembly factor BamE (lipoprotein component of BamABCDE complex)
MTNGEGRDAALRDGPSFWLRLPRRSSAKAGRSLAIRHSSFVICLLAIMFAVSACNVSKKLTKANVDEVIEGMSKKQVESILGPPTIIDTKDFVLLKKTTYLYAQGKESVTVIFKDDKVQSKASTLSE